MIFAELIEKRSLLARKLAWFFRREAAITAAGFQARSLGDFINVFPEFKNTPEERDSGRPEPYLEATRVCRKLVDRGILISAGFNRNHPPLSELYVCNVFDEADLQYGVYDFAAYGFPRILNDLRGAVLPVVVQTAEGDPDIGTAFILQGGAVLTARHCIEGMRHVSTNSWFERPHEVTAIVLPESDNLDLALIRLVDDPFSGRQGFRLGRASILEEVLTMGYPQIPGFNAPLASEPAHIAAVQSSEVIPSAGAAVGLENSYLAGHDLLLITARVKGGNSGGPVVGPFGEVVGMVTAFPAEEAGRADLLGYGLAIPASILARFVSDADSPAGKLRHLPFSNCVNGFGTSKIE